jgi:hypothetical protein
MRFLMKITVEGETFNRHISDGSVEKKMQSILEESKPEAAYFTEFDGNRTAILIVHLKEVSEIPAFAEPWYLLFNAKVQFHPVMLGEDLAKSNLSAVAAKWK